MNRYSTVTSRAGTRGFPSRPVYKTLPPSQRLLGTYAATPETQGGRV